MEYRSRSYLKLLFSGKSLPWKLLLQVIVVFAILYVLSMQSYLLFHTLVELFSIVVAGSVFIIAWNARQFSPSGYLLFVGAALFHVAVIDGLHTLAYKGMGFFAQEGANLPTQLWLGARYLQAGAFLVAPFFVHRKINIQAVVVFFSALTAFFLLSVFYWGVFPVAYVEGVGLTQFKIISEYIISAVFILSIVLLLRQAQHFDVRVLRILVPSIVLMVLAEIAFTEYAGVYDLANMVGHYFKLVAFLLIYRAIIVTGLQKPYEILFRNWKETEEALKRAHDQLELRVQERTAEVITVNQALKAEIEEHMHTEQELRQYREHLEELVRERTAELEQEIRDRRRAEQEARGYSEQLERSNKELEDFASIASHDLQEPLRKVIVFGERLEERIADRLDETEQMYLDRMQAASKRMQNMIESLLSYSRVSTKNVPFKRIDLNRVLHEVLSDLVVRIEQSDGKVDVEELPVVNADPLQMRQLFQNLISNSLKFHRPGVAPLVRVYTEPEENGCVRIVVEDNGIGFNGGDQETIFQPFRRLVGRSQYEGSGMGLAICRKIVERHRGRIGANSSPGEGSRFYVVLPLHPNPSHEEE